MEELRTFTKIKGLSDRRRLPRLGKIRLGVKMISKNGNEYPREVEHFVCPPEVEAVYGKTPKELDVMLPVGDPEVVFPQKLAWYGRSRGPKCIGDGERAMRVDEQTGEFNERECPCEKLGAGGECDRRAHLLVMLPQVSIGGVYQIDMGSYNSIIDVNSGIDYVQALVGRVSMVPLKLRRMARETHGSGKKEIHYTLQLILEGTIRTLNYLRRETLMIPEGPAETPIYALEVPEDINPKMDEGARVEHGEEPPAADPAPAAQRGDGWRAAVNMLSNMKISLKKMELHIGKKKTEWGAVDILLVEATANRIAAGENFDEIIIEKARLHQQAQDAQRAAEVSPAPDPKRFARYAGTTEGIHYYYCADGDERPETYCLDCPTNMDCQKELPPADMFPEA